ncbi:MAG: ACT domain-containing protein [Halioglobus sp.]|nr:ACT domain-containing protein [Halioglobus sp.]
METYYIVSFIGDDRPGLVEQLSQVIEANGGNWHESRLSQLGGKFAGLVLVSLRGDSGDALQRDLKALSARGISVRVTAATSAAAAPETARDIVLTVIGPDRTGIVREIARALARREINVVEMDSRVSSAPMSAERIFEARIEARIPDNTDLDDLTDALEEIANQMTLEIDLE